MAAGWEGANEVGNNSQVPTCEKCGISKEKSELRWFHGGPDGPGSDNGHIAVCKPCAQALPGDWENGGWFGCGCGG